MRNSTVFQLSCRRAISAKDVVREKISSPGQTSTTFHKTLYNICCTLLYVVLSCLTEGWPNDCNISYNTIKHVFKNKVNKGMWRTNYFCCARASTTEYNKVAWGGQTSSTTYNTAENKRNVVSYSICLVKSLIAIKLHTTRYNTIKHDTTRWPNECNI